jgi:hypothetical protein
MREEIQHAARARQKTMVTFLAVALIVGGFIILLLLKRMALPMRLLVGLMDVFAGVTLLVFVRQRFSNDGKR